MPIRRKPPAPPLSLVAPDPAARPVPPPGLPRGAPGGVRVVLEATEAAAVEAAATALKARFGARFAITARRRLPGRAGLRVAATLLVSGDDALDAAAAGPVPAGRPGEDPSGA